MRILLTLICFALLLSASPAQLLSIGIEGGALMTAAPNAFSEVQPDGLGMKYGFNSGLKFNYELPSSSLRFAAGINYGYFERNGKYLIYLDLDGMGYVGESLPKSWVNSDASSNLYSISAGVDWEIADWAAAPYIAGGLILNYYEVRNVNTLELFDAPTEWNDSGTRLGSYIGAGSNIDILQSLSLDISLRYNFYDLFGSRDDTDHIKKVNNNFSAIFFGAALMWNVL